ncbi:hypothetical protein C8Q76DRAFT_790490 [Earliella scabrosa]|nr:hypothetical protein C8Q76DRAFT_790490 [Earliella scabrosa]
MYILQQTLPTFFSTGLISSLDSASTNPHPKDDDEISIYSPSIRLEYRPPTPFPPPFARTLHVEGLPLYLAPSAFMPHTLNALYTALVRNPAPTRPSSLEQDTQHGRKESLRHEPRQQGRRRMGSLNSLNVRPLRKSTRTFSLITGLIHIHNIDFIHPAPHQGFFSALQAALTKIGLSGHRRRSSPFAVVRDTAG